MSAGNIGSVTYPPTYHHDGASLPTAYHPPNNRAGDVGDEKDNKVDDTPHEINEEVQAELAVLSSEWVDKNDIIDEQMRMVFVNRATIKEPNKIIACHSIDLINEFAELAKEFTDSEAGSCIYKCGKIMLIAGDFFTTITIKQELCTAAANALNNLAEWWLGNNFTAGQIDSATEWKNKYTAICLRVTQQYQKEARIFIDLFAKIRGKGIDDDSQNQMRRVANTAKAIYENINGIRLALSLAADTIPTGLRGKIGRNVADILFGVTPLLDAVVTILNVPMTQICLKIPHNKRVTYPRIMREETPMEAYLRERGEYYEKNSFDETILNEKFRNRDATLKLYIQSEIAKALAAAKKETTSQVSTAAQNLTNVVVTAKRTAITAARAETNVAIAAAARRTETFASGAAATAKAEAIVAAKIETDAQVAKATQHAETFASAAATKAKDEAIVVANAETVAQVATATRNAETFAGTVAATAKNEAIVAAKAETDVLVATATQQTQVFAGALATAAKKEAIDAATQQANDFATREAERVLALAKASISQGTQQAIEEAQKVAKREGTEIRYNFVQYDIWIKERVEEAIAVELRRIDESSRPQRTVVVRSKQRSPNGALNLSTSPLKSNGKELAVTAAGAAAAAANH